MKSIIKRIFSKPTNDSETELTISLNEQNPSNTVFITYLDNDNDKSERNITIKSIQNTDNDLLIKAYCHLRNADRSFKLSQISSLVDSNTGEVVENISDFLNSLDVPKTVGVDKNEQYCDESYFTEMFKRTESKYDLKALDKLCTLFYYDEGGIEVQERNISIDYIDDIGNKVNIKGILEVVERNPGYEFHLCVTVKNYKGLKWIDIEKIETVIDIDSNNVIADLPEFLYKICNESPKYITNNIFLEVIREIDVLVFLARADGKMVKQEREIIVEYIYSRYPKVDTAILDESIKNYKITNNRFKESVKFIKENNPELIDGLKEAMYQIVKFDKEVDPMETATLELFDNL